MTDTTELETKRETVYQRWQAVADKNSEAAIELVRQYESLSDQIRQANFIPFTKAKKAQ